MNKSEVVWPQSFCHHRGRSAGRCCVLSYIPKEGALRGGRWEEEDERRKMSRGRVMGSNHLSFWKHKYPHWKWDRVYLRGQGMHMHTHMHKEDSKHRSTQSTQTYADVSAGALQDRITAPVMLCPCGPFIYRVPYFGIQRNIETPTNHS